MMFLWLFKRHLANQCRQHVEKFYGRFPARAGVDVLKPWISADMSRATYYRNLKRERETVSATVCKDLYILPPKESHPSVIGLDEGIRRKLEANYGAQLKEIRPIDGTSDCLVVRNPTTGEAFELVGVLKYEPPPFVSHAARGFARDNIPCLAVCDAFYLENPPPKDGKTLFRVKHWLKKESNKIRLADARYKALASNFSE
jgi:hypothetical protein